MSESALADSRLTSVEVWGKILSRTIRKSTLRGWQRGLKMTDVNTLDLNPPEPIEGDVEKGNVGKPFVMPPDGLYTGVLRVQPEVGKTREKGLLQFLLNPITIVGGEHDGFEVRYTRINVQKWPNRNSNGVLDYLAAFGITEVPTTNERYIDLVRSTVGTPFAFWGRWEGKCKTCAFKLKGQAKFPKGAEGQLLSRIACPTCSKDEAHGGDVVVFANLTVGSFGVRS